MFGGMQFTNRGRNLQAKVQAGVQLNFTRIAMGDGELGGSAIADLTNLVHQVQTYNITKLKTLSGGKAVVGTVMSNQGLAVGFYWRELGVFATDPDLGEILYCYGNAGAAAEYIPAGGGPDIVEKAIDVVSIIGNAANVSAAIDQSLIYAKEQDLVAHVNDDVVHISAADRGAWNAKETTAGAQAKADAAAAAGVAAANAVQANLDSHKADYTAHNLASKLDKNGGTIEAYTEKEVANAAAAGTVTLDLSAQNVFEITLADNVIIELSNVPAAGKACSFSIVIHQGATAKTVTFPAPFKWMGGSIPDLSAVSKTHIIFGTTVDGGVTIYANAATNF